MSGPRFTILARIDDLHFIAACPHGVAHLTWENATLRFTLDEFKALAYLMERTIAARAPVMLTDGSLSVRGSRSIAASSSLGRLRCACRQTTFADLQQP